MSAVYYMCSYFKNKYLIGSKRKSGYDYSMPGKYFITICTKNRIPYFGKIVNGKMVLSEIGRILKTEWLKTPAIRTDMNITIDEFVIMPDHFHAIIIIGKNQYNYPRRNAMHGVSTGIMHGVSTGITHGVSTYSINNYRNEFAPQHKNISSIIRGVKSAVTKSAKIIQMEFYWQPRYYDHIIRNQTEFERIRKYILENPKKGKGFT